MEKEEDKEGSVNNDLPLFSYIGDFMNVIGETEGFDFWIIFFGDNEKKCIENIWTGLEHFGYPDVIKIKEVYKVE